MCSLAFELYVNVPNSVQKSRSVSMRVALLLNCFPSVALLMVYHVGFIKDNGLVPIVEPEILLDGEHGIDRTAAVAEKVWNEVFYFLAKNNVMYGGILLKPSMVTPGAECKERASPEKVADYTLKLLKRRVPPSVPGIMVSSHPLF